MANAVSRPLRLVRSFIRREGRLTRGQQRALKELWPRYGVEPKGLLDLDKLFGHNAQRTLEIGFGNGETLAYLATQNSATDFLGIEVHRPGVGRLLLELEQRGLTNVRVMQEDAVEVLRRHLPDASLDRILILFPDPWPKKRHHKRRLVQPEFAGLLAKKLTAGGKLQMATDWGAYANYMLEVMESNGSFRNLEGSGNFARRPAALPVTKFEHRGKRLGHEVWNLNYEKI
ncbi:MAG: tRNA (guanosine(46)-N7)-methyltransferase TrmB [Gammaproteobacteria bacterium]